MDSTSCQISKYLVIFYQMHSVLVIPHQSDSIWIKRKKKIKVKAGICSFYRTHPGSQVSLGSAIIGRGQKTSTFHEERPVQRYDRLKLKLKCKFQLYLYKLPPRQVPRRPSFVHNWPAFKFAPRVPLLPLQIIADI